ncbi:hypothetical protein GCM10023224_04710 [Streptomonospora halophila]|uniref:Uncharacterized protein n=1 Tax=Streptomonospora halophila TaxID=427369 RepID=A0ABP9G533_9ACTN
MYFFLSLVLFYTAFWLNKKLKGRTAGMSALVVGLGASMLLYRSQASQTILGWCNDNLVGGLAGFVASAFGEPLPTTVIWGVLCIGGFAITCMDLYKDHTYNTIAIVALIVTPIAAHGASSGALPSMIDGIHTFGAELVAGIVGGAVGS